jgi:hypothetical protein
MESSDLDHSLASLGVEGARSPSAAGLALIGQMAAETVLPLTAALARIDAVLATGRLDRAGLKALRADVEQALLVAETGRQMQRAGSAVSVSNPELIELGPALREAVLRRTRKTEALGIVIRQIIKPAQVAVDPALLLELLESLLDWSIAHARSGIELRVEVMSWPAHAVLDCRFMHRPPDQADELPPTDTRGYVARSLDTMVWLLVRARASALGLIARREDTPVHTSMSLEFPRTVNEMVIDTLSAPLQLKVDIGTAAPVLSHVLVLAARREMRNQVRESIRRMELAVHYAADLDAARDDGARTPPQIVVYEAAFSGDFMFARWRDELRARAPDTAFIELSNEGVAMEIVIVDGHQITRIGRDAVTRSLPSALSFELERQAGR